MKILGINHIGIAPKDAAKASWFFQTVMGLEHLGDEAVISQKTNTLMFTSGSETTSSARLELLEPMGSGPIQKFLDTRGSGVHHIALTVDSIDRAIEHMLDHKVEMIDETPRGGAHNTRIAFVHPRATGGFLVELVEQT